MSRVGVLTTVFSITIGIRIQSDGIINGSSGINTSSARVRGWIDGDDPSLRSDFTASFFLDALAVQQDLWWLDMTATERHVIFDSTPAKVLISSLIRDRELVDGWLAWN